MWSVSDKTGRESIYFKLHSQGLGTNWGFTCISHSHVCGMKGGKRRSQQEANAWVTQRAHADSFCGRPYWATLPKPFSSSSSLSKCPRGWIKAVGANHWDLRSVGVSDVENGQWDLRAHLQRRLPWKIFFQQYARTPRKASSAWFLLMRLVMWASDAPSSRRKKKKGQEKHENSKPLPCYRKSPESSLFYNVQTLAS